MVTMELYLLPAAYSDSVLRHASSDFKKMGQRIFLFIVGGATRSEVNMFPIHSSRTLYGYLLLALWVSDKLSIIFS